MELHVDVETYCDLDLRDVGAHVYANHPSMRLLLISWAVGDDPIQTWAIPREARRCWYHPESDAYFWTEGSGELDENDPDAQLCVEVPILPYEFSTLAAQVVAYGGKLVAHNAAFERAILGALFPGQRWLDARHWRCTLVHALALAMPGHLDDLGDVLGCGRKLDSGKALIRKFCTPHAGGYRARTQREWDEFIAYNRQDVELERQVLSRFAVYPLRDEDWAHWALDQRINDRGVPIDVEFCRAAAEVAERNVAALADVSCARGVESLTSLPKLKAWLAEQGFELANLRADTIEAQLDDPETPVHVREVLAARIEMAGASVKKYRVAVEATDADGRARGLLQFWGARRTGRWSGRRIQIQNLPRGSIEDPTELFNARAVVRDGYEMCALLYPQVSDLLRSLVRTAICAPAGMTLVSADLASIESVMLAWASNCTPLLRVFVEGRDPYIDFATRLFGVPYDQVTKAMRKLAKPAVLGCGYGMSATGLQAYAAGMGVTLTADEAAKHVSLFRQTYPAIPRFWTAVEDAALSAMSAPGTRVTVPNAGAVPFAFFRQGSFLFLFLPSGRRLAYFRAGVDLNQWGHQQLTYDNGEGRRFRIGTRGAKLVENIVQAIARDVLVEGLERAELAGIQVVAHVHDEIVALAPAHAGTATLEALKTAMGHAPGWALGAPIRAAGWCGPVYRKD